VNGTQITILVTYSIVVLLAVVVALALSETTRRRAAIDVHRLAELEKNWLGIVVLILVAILAATIWFTPYGKSTPPGAQIVKVDASQFFWKISPRRVTMRRPVAFVTRASDVNHGFGIFRGRKLIAQIQVVPDKDSTLIHTFTEPGTYTVLCLEFCGVGHDRMESTFEVTR
jgi:cytochrome c oxidase subunit II